MILEESQQTRKTEESSTENLYDGGEKRCYRFQHTVRPKQIIESAFRNIDAISSYHTSRITKDYYTVGLLLSPENEPAEQIRLEIWDAGCAIYLDDTCPESYLPPLIEAIEAEIALIN